MIGDFFFAGDKTYNADEIPSDKEVKTSEALAVDLPPAQRRLQHARSRPGEEITARSRTARGSSSGATMAADPA